MGSTVFDVQKKWLDGRVLAERLKDNLRSVLQKYNVKPGLALVSVGDDPASRIYLKHKRNACASVGIESTQHRLPETATLQEVQNVIRSLNHDSRVHGILLQLPLPASLDAHVLIDEIVPEKDVDGLTTHHQGLLAQGRPDVVSCTPLGCLMLLQQVIPDLSGLRVGIVGRSVIVGRPLASLMLAHHATVTHTHSRTLDLEDLMADQDVIIAAVGSPGLIRASHVKEGAVVIDVGINRGAPGVSLTGDVDAASVHPKVKALTPVPGGVGPMTVACLLHNTVRQACREKEMLVF